MLVALFSAHVFLFAYKEEGQVDHPKFGSFLCEIHRFFQPFSPFNLLFSGSNSDTVL